MPDRYDVHIDEPTPVVTTPFTEKVVPSQVILLPEEIPIENFVTPTSFPR